MVSSYVPLWTIQLLFQTFFCIYHSFREILMHYLKWDTLYLPVKNICCSVWRCAAVITWFNNKLQCCHENLIISIWIIFLKKITSTISQFKRVCVFNIQQSLRENFYIIRKSFSIIYVILYLYKINQSMLYNKMLKTDLRGCWTKDRTPTGILFYRLNALIHIRFTR